MQILRHFHFFPQHPLNLDPMSSRFLLVLFVSIFCIKCKFKPEGICVQIGSRSATVEDIIKYLPSGEWVYSYSCLDGVDTLHKVNFSHDIPYKLVLVKSEIKKIDKSNPAKSFFERHKENPLYRYKALTWRKKSGVSIMEESKPLILSGKMHDKSSKLIVHYRENMLLKNHMYHIKHIDSVYLIIQDNILNSKNGRRFSSSELIYIKQPFKNH